MYLSNLDIFGFKSFANKTNFKFSPGMAALVGPNGCGKTNIVDAVRWVLGEQKSAVLRSDVMENVIFNGTKMRKPLGMAEVTLTIENNRGLLPTEYNQITIARRLFRNGESQYLLNKTQCRLRDILDLFMDTGMGSDSYSVIELKMVEAILSGRVDERRAMFEEAAGIKKYKQRRKEATRKLETIQLDLERVQDILQEVRKNVNSLSRQAAKTKKYNSLLSELKGLEIHLLKHEYYANKIADDKLIIELSELNKNKIRFEIELSETEASIKEFRLELNELESEFALARNEENKLNSGLASKNQAIAVSHERLTSLEKAKERLERERTESKGSIDTLTLNHEKSKERLSELAKSIEKADAEFINLKQKRDAALSVEQSIREKSGKANEESMNIQSRINSLNSVLKRNEDKKNGLERKLNQSAEEKIRLGRQLEDIESDEDTLEGKKKELDEDLDIAEHELQLAQENKQSLQNRSDELRQHINDKKNMLGSKKASLEFLQGLIDTNESARFLIGAKDWDFTKDRIVLAEAVGADEEHRVAVEAALGDAGDYFVVDTKQEAYSAFKALTDHKKGKATFLCREILPTVPSPESIETSDKVFGWLSEIVRVDDQLRSALRAILGKTVVVADMDTGLMLVNSNIADTAVTLTGEIISRTGIMRGGATLQKEGLRVGKKERIDILKKDMKAATDEIALLEKELADVREEFDSIDIRKMTEEVRSAEKIKAENLQKISSLKLKLQQIEQNLELVEENTARFADELAEFHTEETDFKTELDELAGKLNDARNEYHKTLVELKESEDTRRDWEGKARRSEMNAVQSKSEMKSLEGEISRLENQLVSIKNRSLTIDADISASEREMVLLEESILKDEAELKDINENIDEAKNKSAYLAEQKKVLQDQTDQISDDVNRKRKQYDGFKEQIHLKELDAGALKTNMKNIAERFLETFEKEIEAEEFIEDPEFSINENKHLLADIKGRLSLLGNVNFMALEEYDTQSERLEFYERQMNDLTESERILEETIAEINLTAEKKFIDTFEKIKENFQMLFNKLFGPEGSADLKMDEGNPLEANIEIMAKPPFKRPHSIEMLSGGEKTLTAIALLFAIYLVKPSPFCILDEVDAPLDDTNIDKFVSMIREFSVETQFLIVTHNKKTMEAADTLYGVTMMEDGISKVVSVRINQAEA